MPAKLLAEDMYAIAQNGVARAWNSTGMKNGNLRQMSRLTGRNETCERKTVVTPLSR